MAALFDIAATTLAVVGEWSAFPRAPRLLRGRMTVINLNADVALETAQGAV
jgi:hypothetical protein